MKTKRERGFDTRHPGVQSDEELRAELESLGAQWKEVEAVRFPHRYNLRTELDRYAGRVFSDTWSIPEETYQASLSELREWAMHQYGDLDREIEETNRFVFDVAYFNSQAGRILPQP